MYLKKKTKILKKENIDSQTTFKVVRNASNTGDIFSIEKNGVKTHSKELKDNEIKEIGYNFPKIIMNFLRRKESENIHKPSTRKSSNSSVSNRKKSTRKKMSRHGGGHKVEIVEKGDFKLPNEIKVDENTYVYKVVYTRRSWFSIFSRVFAHLLLLTLFFYFYIIFFIGYVVVQRKMPLGFYTKKVVMKKI